MSYLKPIVIALLVGTSATVFAATDTTGNATPTTDTTATTQPADVSTSSQTTTTTTKTTTKSSNGQNLRLGKMSCREFLVFGESDRPNVVYWAVGHIKGKKNEVLFVDETNRLVPIIVDECTAHPEQSFWKTLKEKAKGIF